MRPLREILLGLLCVGLFLWLIFPREESKEQTRASFCLSQLKRQAIAFSLYAEDHDDRFPFQEVWMDRLLPYAASKEIFRDPGPAWKTVYGYAFNAALSRAKAPARPETVPLVYDSTATVRNASDFMTSLPRPGRHEGRDSVAYADGHARAVTP